MENNTSELVNKVLDEFPEQCVVDRGRLCIRISTAVARAEHASKFGKSDEEILTANQEAVAAVGKRCLNGIQIEQSLTTCGYQTISHPQLKRTGETDGDV